MKIKFARTTDAICPKCEDYLEDRNSKYFCPECNVFYKFVAENVPK